MYYSDPAIFFRPRVAYCRAVIRRTVINKYDFKIFICLRNYTFNASIQILFGIVNRNYNANRFCNHKNTSLKINFKYSFRQWH